MSQKQRIEICPGEVWYGLCVEDGVCMPITSQKSYARELTPNTTVNGAAGVLLSSDGRYLYSPGSVAVHVQNGILEMDSPDAEVFAGKGGKTLRDAWMALIREHLPVSGETPPDLFFTAPQYNTWIELLYHQSQEGVLQYARDLINQGYPPGVLMIDDGWMQDYGVWEFRPDAFANPRSMVDQLHAMGFRVMLWVCPFVSADSPVFRALSSTSALLKNADGEPAVRCWWNGYSAVLDLSSPVAQDWLHGRLKRLMDEFGIDGFKLDAGVARFYRDDDQSAGQVSANEQSSLWAVVGLRYPYNELRACYGMSNAPLVHRLADKNHSWDDKGMRSLVPNTLMQGLLGYPFGCPDMIGGGEYANFMENSERLDQELFVRYAQCAALLPMMQFSAAPWRVLDEEHAALCKQAALLRRKYGGRILQLAWHAAQTGDPIARCMEYAFPHQGLERVLDQFMLGEDYLVAPVLTRGSRERSVMLPRGRWKYMDGMLYEGGVTVRVHAELDELPIFERIV